MAIARRIILGIDPGSIHMGVGCIEKKGNQIDLIFADVINAPAKKDLYTRLQYIHQQFELLLEKLQPNEVAIEGIFYGKNVKSAFSLGLARGAAITACLSRDLKIFEYAPTQVKSAMTGSGRADKWQVKKMTQLTLGTKIDKGLDATDALAIAICHANMMRVGGRC